MYCSGNQAGHDYHSSKSCSEFQKKPREICNEFSFMTGSAFTILRGLKMMFSSRPANDLAVDVKVEHAAFVSCANIQLTALGGNGGILKANANGENR